jgi:hypothetical protein
MERNDTNSEPIFTGNSNGERYFTIMAVPNMLFKKLTKKSDSKSLLVSALLIERAIGIHC